MKPPFDTNPHWQGRDRRTSSCQDLSNGAVPEPASPAAPSVRISTSHSRTLATTLTLRQSSDALKGPPQAGGHPVVTTRPKLGAPARPAAPEPLQERHDADSRNRTANVWPDMTHNAFPDRLKAPALQRRCQTVGGRAPANGTVPTHCAPKHRNATPIPAPAMPLSGGAPDDATWRDSQLRASLASALDRRDWRAAGMILRTTTDCRSWLQGETVGQHTTTLIEQGQLRLAARLLALALAIDLSRQQQLELALLSMRHASSATAGAWIERLQPRGAECTALLCPALERRKHHLVRRLLDAGGKLDEVPRSMVSEAVLTSIETGNDRAALAFFQMTRWDLTDRSTFLVTAVEHGQRCLVQRILATFDPKQDSHRAKICDALSAAVEAGDRDIAARLFSTGVGIDECFRDATDLIEHLVATGNTAGLTVVRQIGAVSANHLFERLYTHGQTVLISKLQEALAPAFPRTLAQAGRTDSANPDQAVIAGLLSLCDGVGGDCHSLCPRRIGRLLAAGMRSEVAEAIEPLYRRLMLARLRYEDDCWTMTPAQLRMAFAALLCELEAGLDMDRSDFSTHAMAGMPEPAQGQLMLLRRVARRAVRAALVPLGVALQTGSLAIFANRQNAGSRTLLDALTGQSGVPARMAMALAAAWTQALRSTGFPVAGPGLAGTRTGSGGHSPALNPPPRLRWPERPRQVPADLLVREALERLRRLPGDPGAAVPGALQSWVDLTMHLVIAQCEALADGVALSSAN